MSLNCEIKSYAFDPEHKVPHLCTREAGHGGECSFAPKALLLELHALRVEVARLREVEQVKDAIQAQSNERLTERIEVQAELDRVNTWLYALSVSFNEVVKLQTSAEEKLQHVMSLLQRYQPAGSPPPGDEYVLAAWILRTMAEKGPPQWAHSIAVSFSASSSGELAGDSADGSPTAPAAPASAGKVSERTEEERDALTPAQEAEPVHHVESEQVVLGAFLQSSITFAHLAKLLCADDFFISAHRHIFEAMCEIAPEGPVTPMLVTLQLKRRGLMGVDVPRELPEALALAGGPNRISAAQANHAVLTVATLGRARRRAGKGT